jgi:hypothetical protein
MRVKILHHLTRGNGSSCVAANAIGHDEQFAQGNLDMEDGVLIFLAHGAAIAHFGE